MNPNRLAHAGVLLALLRRELALAVHQKGEVLTPLVFFVVVASLFPLGVGPESALLLRMAPGVLWVSALLAAMLSLQRQFECIVAVERTVRARVPLRQVAQHRPAQVAIVGQDRVERVFVVADERRPALQPQ